MIIGIDGSRAFVENKTGTENYSYQLLKALAKIDTQNRYLIYLRPGVKIETKWPNNFRFQILNFKFLWTQIGLASQTFKDELDVLFVPAHTLPIVLKPGLKTVVTVHDLGSEFLPKTHQLKQRLYLSFMQKAQLRGTTHLIAVSYATKDDLVKRIGIRSEKITVIYEGYDKKNFKPVKIDTLVSTLKQYGLEIRKYFLFVGTVQPRKNLERLITAFKFSDLSNLVIVGQKGWMSDQIYALPKKLNIEEKVKFLGYVPDENMPALYSGAIALIYPSLFEGFGLPVLEAQACGCPVITSNCSSMPEAAGKGAILVDPYNIDDIVEAMREVQSSKFIPRLCSGQEVQSLRKAGFENIRRFNWEKCARETLDLLEKVGNK